MTEKIMLSHRLATTDDVPTIMELMKLAIAQNMKAFLTPAEILAAQATMGLDSSLLKDQTYFVIETNHQGKMIMVGCGGWGRRKTLYGGDHTKGRDDRLADPSRDAARIRAMYTHPSWTRKGIGALLIELGEDAARKEGFKTIELGSTLAGEPLYRAMGFVEVSREEQITSDGSSNVIILMRKPL